MLGTLTFFASSSTARSVGKADGRPEVYQESGTILQLGRALGCPTRRPGI
jgi:hypothetical protein